MPRPNANAALRLDPDRPRVIPTHTWIVVRLSDGAEMGSGELMAMARLLDALGPGFEARQRGGKERAA